MIYQLFSGLSSRSHKVRPSICLSVRHKFVYSSKSSSFLLKSSSFQLSRSAPCLSAYYDRKTEPKILRLVLKDSILAFISNISFQLLAYSESLTDQVAILYLMLNTYKSSFEEISRLLMIVNDIGQSWIFISIKVCANLSFNIRILPADDPAPHPPTSDKI